MQPRVNLTQIPGVGRYADKREADKMEDWDQSKLEEVVNSKHSKQVVHPTTDIVSLCRTFTVPMPPLPFPSLPRRLPLLRSRPLAIIPFPALTFTFFNFSCVTCPPAGWLVSNLLVSSHTLLTDEAASLGCRCASISLMPLRTTSMAGFGCAPMTATPANTATLCPKATSSRRTASGWRR